MNVVDDGKGVKTNMILHYTRRNEEDENSQPDNNAKKWTKVPFPSNIDPSPLSNQKNSDVSLDVDVDNILDKFNIPMSILELTKYPPHMNHVKQ